ncbi:PREDICTED: translation initiation factor IF-2-like [Calidris pugnax]|uniref:translation initiation factor IF-2-like n=1 Tax=Calidris pugnax TaxID=198806 RepID=UPI00071CA82A|nr:PREDICTED: translation initiation factor IF-2-like [Calidris pugnax]
MKEMGIKKARAFAFPLTYSNTQNPRAAARPVPGDQISQLATPALNTGVGAPRLWLSRGETEVRPRGEEEEGEREAVGPGTQVRSAEGKGDFLGFLPCKYLPPSGGGGGPTPLRGRWEAPRLAPASPAPRPPLTPASRPRSAPHPRTRSAPHRTEGQRAARAAGGGNGGNGGGGSGDNPPATTHPGGSGMEYTKTQRKSGWTVLGAKCWKFWLD